MSKKTYVVNEGVPYVNATRVPENREIKLSAKEAQFDLDQGRIKLKDEQAPVAEPAPTDAPAALPAPETSAQTTKSRR